MNYSLIRLANCISNVGNFSNNKKKQQQLVAYDSEKCKGSSGDCGRLPQKMLAICKSHQCVAPLWAYIFMTVCISHTCSQYMTAYLLYDQLSVATSNCGK